MTERNGKALRNAAASSAMEGMPMEQRHFEAVKKMKDGNMTLQEYLKRLAVSAKKDENMAYSIDAIQDDCYPDSTVLINKLDIRDEAILADAELAAVRLQ